MTIVRRRTVVTLAALAVTATLAVGPATASTAARPGGDAPHDGGHGATAGFTFAVIGDIPYGAAQIANFPNVIAQLNADPAVELVDHLGDIKSGSSVCSDEYFASIKAQFDTCVDPLVYTVGDNEWTDCHRVNNGSYNPLERLATLRTVFFPRPDYTLGQHAVRMAASRSSGL